MSRGKPKNRQEQILTRLMKLQSSGDPTSLDVVSLEKYICLCS